MYESVNRSFSWFGILRKILMLIIFMILLFGLTYYCSNKKNNKSADDKVKTKEVTKASSEKKKENEKVTKAKEAAKKAKAKAEEEAKKANKEFKYSIKQLENTSLKYFTADKLPTKDNETKTVTLDKFINRGDLKSLKTDSGKKCDTEKSKVTIKKLKDKYQMTTTIVSGKLKKVSKTYVGCFDNCVDGKICKGTSESKNGICTVKKVVDDAKENAKQQVDGAKDLITNNNNNNSNTNQNNTNSNSSTTNNNTPSTPQKPKVTYYEYQKCVTTYYCEAGSLNRNNECVVTKNKTYVDKYGKSSQSSISSYFAPKPKTTCETTWNQATSLSGWTRTGRTKVE